MLKDADFYIKSEEKLWELAKKALEDKNSRDLFRFVWMITKGQTAIKNLNETYSTIEEVTKKTQEEWNKDYELMKTMLG